MLHKLLFFIPGIIHELGTFEGFAYLDDITGVITEYYQVKNILKLMNVFGQESGLNLNQNKIYLFLLSDRDINEYKN